jgi:hypothetical protein
MPLAFDLVPSAQNPTQLHVLAAVQVQKLATLPAVGTTYAALASATEGVDQRRLDEFGAYVLSTFASAEPGWLICRFVPTETDASRRVPFRTTASNRMYSWPAVLYEIRFEIDQNNPRSGEDSTGVIFTPRGLVNHRYRPAGTYLSPTKTEEFASLTQWKANQMPCVQPQGMPVTWNYYGDSDGFSEVLHEGVTVPPQYEVYTRSGGGTIPGLVQEEQVYPATNFSDWTQFVLADEQEFNKGDGLWYRTRVTILPPPGRVEVIDK